ncbi:hypothetical protein WOLCODRAFT_98569 [Wolfiporia cocos MD-104 SS10]|uniref:Borealin N-terminal domain-containing protein n=1 Tax=Wolfiporia cocos (strain MD-104) TaxID=742152 RepID=A0A2H3JDG4_WOLCO|nr:hypothetical protein WOLCODRAFT_98569 [Wolfiporia cocos MD-104 SS10]
MPGTPPQQRRYTAEEKEQLLANLDLEVEHRARQFEEWLADTLENFRMRQEGLILRVPRDVRGITLREFARYGGDVQECVRGLRRARLGAEEPAPDRSTRKRKWVAEQDAKAESSAQAAAREAEAESSRGVKSARTVIATTATPKKKVGYPSGLGSAQRPRFAVPKTPGTRIPSAAMASPSPHRAAASRPTHLPRIPPRATTPSKLPTPSEPLHTKLARPPSVNVFNPSLPLSQPRWPRKDESMLSVNGSPLKNPFQLGLDGYLKTVAGDDGDGGPESEGNEGESARKRPRLQKSSIIIRQSSLSQPHSRANSNSTANTGGSRAEDVQNGEDAQNSALPALSALVSVPTLDGHVLEFDPWQTSPAEIDALQAISDDAKQQAKEDMARLIQAAVERWKIS